MDRSWGPGGSWESYSLQEGVIGVAWREVGDLQDVTSKQELRDLLDVKRPGAPDQKTAQLWAFVGEMQPGDMVAMPRAGADTVAIGEVTGAYRHVEDGRSDVPQVRDVQWLDEAVAESRFATDLRTYFGLPATLTPIRKARDPDNRLRTVATSELPDGYEPGGPLAEATRPAPFVLADLEGLPDGPSVHTVWGPDGALLYVGHSGRPLRERLLEHLRGDRSASATSCTGASACCSTPASPTGPCSPRSPHDPAQIRRAPRGTRPRTPLHVPSEGPISSTPTQVRR